MNSHKHKNSKHFSIIPLSIFCLVIISVTSLIYHLNKSKTPISDSVNINDISEKKDRFSNITFAFAGDYGANKNTKKVFSLINGLKPDFHIVLGDMSYDQIKQESAWCDLVKSFVPETPIVLLSGNHESDGQNGDIERFADCLPFNLSTSLIGEYTKDYYFDYPKTNPLARFIMISPDITFKDEKLEYTKDSLLLKNLIKNIEDAKVKQIPWVIVSAHKPCISTEVLHRCETGIDLPKEIIDKGVDLYINGHSHIYQRSFMLSCIDGETANLDCINEGKNGVFEKDSGTVFVTSGVGGVGVRRTNNNSSLAPYFTSTHSANNNPVYGLSFVELDRDSLELKFINAENGEVIDYIKIQKNGTN